MNIQTQGKQAFNVPNDSEGQEFLRLLHKFRNPGWYYRARGRGPRKEHGTALDISQTHSAWLAVYLTQENPKAVCGTYQDGMELHNPRDLEGPRDGFYDYDSP